jgi:hypothetical protein
MVSETSNSSTVNAFSSGASTAKPYRNVVTV